MEKIRELNRIENIDLTYKWSYYIASFNYDANKTILKEISTTNLDQLDVDNILYVTALIELLGPAYINYAIKLFLVLSFKL